MSPIYEFLIFTDNESHMNSFSDRIITAGPAIPGLMPHPYIKAATLFEHGFNMMWRIYALCNRQPQMIDPTVLNSWLKK